MSKIVNLRQIRKQRMRDENRAKADANAVKFGETTAVRKLREADRAREARTHEAHKRDD